MTFDPKKDIYVEHEPCESGGVQWGRHTVFRTFKKLPFYERIWIDFQLWRNS